MTDLSVLALHILKEIDLKGDALKAADVNGDGEVDITDLSRIKQYVSKKITKF